MLHFNRDCTRFHYRDTGDGVPFVFQHGLGGDLEQPFGIFNPPTGIRLLAFDFRAHGQTEPLGPVHKISLATFADDLAAFLDHLHIEQAVTGGISMGAAVTINFALRYPGRVLGLVQARPAWFEGPNRENGRKCTYIAELLRNLGPERGKAEFEQSDMFHKVLAEAPNAAESLLGQFDNPQAVERRGRLERIPLDAPYESLGQLAAITVPTLVLANRQDPIHPFFFGEAIADAITGSEFHEITSKSVSVEQHNRGMQLHLCGFLQQNFIIAK